MQPLYRQIYKQSFDQKEVNGMIQFYSSDVGQSVVSKMPTVLRQSSQLMQQQMQTLMPLMPLMQETTERFGQRMQSLHDRADHADARIEDGASSTK